MLAPRTIARSPSRLISAILDPCVKRRFSIGTAPGIKHEYSTARSLDRVFSGSDAAVRVPPADAVLKQTSFEALKTLCRNHRERRRLLVEVSNRLSLENPGNAGARIGGGSDDGHSSVPDVWHRAPGKRPILSRLWLTGCRARH